jgi:hypothetical protein
MLQCQALRWKSTSFDISSGGIPLSKTWDRRGQPAAHSGERSRSPDATFLHLLSADTDHSFWIPQLAGKTDLTPNHPNNMWMDPQRTGLFLGQCAQYCGTQYAKQERLPMGVLGPMLTELCYRGLL